MNPFDYYINTFKNNYFNFEGRARRSEFWYFVLFNFLISLAISIIFWPLSVVYTLVALLPGLGLSVRRLHDTGRSGWWLLMCLIPYLGFIGAIVLIVWYATEGDFGNNQYGADPKGLDDEEEDILDHLVD